MSGSNDDRGRTVFLAKLFDGLGAGRSQVSAGNSSVVVTHGLGGTPVAVALTQIGQPVNVAMSVSAADADTFTVTLAAVQQTTLHFAWFGYQPNGG